MSSDDAAKKMAEMRALAAQRFNKAKETGEYVKKESAPMVPEGDMTAMKAIMFGSSSSSISSFFSSSSSSSSGPSLVGKIQGVRPQLSDVMRGKEYLLLYFSASWCPPCRAFTPHLADFYNAKSKLESNSFEIIFVSRDRDEASFKDYFAKMPWLAIEFGSSEADALARLHEVQGIPSLVIYSVKQRKIVSKDGVSLLMGDRGAGFPYA